MPMAWSMAVSFVYHAMGTCAMAYPWQAHGMVHVHAVCMPRHGHVPWHAHGPDMVILWLPDRGFVGKIYESMAMANPMAML